MNVSTAALLGFDEAPPPPVVPLGFLGIDPGLQGFVFFMSPSGYETFPVPTISLGRGKRRYDLPAVRNLTLSFRGRVSLTLIERQQAMPQNGVLGNFMTGYGYGLWEMALTAAGISYQSIRPQAWKKAMGVSPPPSTDKRKAKDLTAKERRDRSKQRRKVAKALAVSAAQHLFPGVDLRRSERCRVLDDNKCEAALLAELARRLHAGR